MTLRRRLRTIVLSTALITGGLAAVPLATGAASAAAPAPAMRNDPMAPIAAQALDSLVEYASTGDMESRKDYNNARHALAVEIATRLSVDPAALEDAWRSADVQHQEALMAAFSQLGVPYRGYQSKPGVGFDCSGLVMYAWAQAGVQLPRSSGTQINSAVKRTADTAEAGDILYYPGHAMMWLGVGTAIVHAPYTGRTVEVDFVTKSHKSVRFGDPIG